MTAASLDWTYAEREATPRIPSFREPPVGPELRAILARKDDRLLRDVGLTREQVLGPEEAFRTEHRGSRAIWNL